MRGSIILNLALVIILISCQREPVGVSKIVANRKILDIGEVKQGENAAGQFVLKNEGNKIGKIISVEPDCHCTMVNYDSTEIKPQDSIFLKVTFDKSVIGYFQKLIKVNLEDGQQPILLILRGKID